MANLQKCKECGKEISKNAKVCPHCGEPKPVKKGTSFFTWLFLSVVVYALMIYVVDSNNANHQPYKRSSSVKVVKTECEKMADYIKNLRYITAHNNNNQEKYQMDRWKTEEQLKKFRLDKCNENLLIDNSWNPLTDGTIKQ